MLGEGFHGLPGGGVSETEEMKIDKVRNQYDPGVTMSEEKKSSALSAQRLRKLPNAAFLTKAWHNQHLHPRTSITAKKIQAIFKEGLVSLWKADHAHLIPLRDRTEQRMPSR